MIQRGRQRPRGCKMQSSIGRQRKPGHIRKVTALPPPFHNLLKGGDTFPQHNSVNVGSIEILWAQRCMVSTDQRDDIGVKRLRCFQNPMRSIGLHNLAARADDIRLEALQCTVQIRVQLHIKQLDLMFGNRCADDFQAQWLNLG